MKWELDWNDPFTQYLAPFDQLVGDRRTWTTLTETVRGIIGSGSLVCQRIAAQSPILSQVKKGAQLSFAWSVETPSNARLASMPRI
jgi:hypothetical protein